MKAPVAYGKNGVRKAKSPGPRPLRALVEDAERGRVGPGLSGRQPGHGAVLPRRLLSAHRVRARLEPHRVRTFPQVQPLEERRELPLVVLQLEGKPEPVVDQPRPDQPGRIRGQLVPYTCSANPACGAPSTRCEAP